MCVCVCVCVCASAASPASPAWAAGDPVGPATPFPAMLDTVAYVRGLERGMQAVWEVFRARGSRREAMQEGVPGTGAAAGAGAAGRPPDGAVASDWRMHVVVRGERFGEGDPG